MQFLNQQKVAFNSSENFPTAQFESLNHQAAKTVSAEHSESEFNFSASVFQPDKSSIFMPNEIITTDQKKRFAVKS